MCPLIRAGIHLHETFTSRHGDFGVNVSIVANSHFLIFTTMAQVVRRRFCSLHRQFSSGISPASEAPTAAGGGVTGAGGAHFRGCGEGFLSA